MAAGTETFNLKGVISLVDRSTNTLNKVREAFDLFRQKSDLAGDSLIEFNKKMGKIQMGAGAGLFAVGVVSGWIAKNMIGASLETGKLKSNLESLSMSAKDVEFLNINANKITSELGIAKSAYLAGAYDIKSAISTMGTVDLASYAKTVSETAIATKGDMAEMSKLFGLTHNTYKDMYKGMADKDIGKVIGNSISYAVKGYTTDGRKMSYAMQALGSSAKLMQIPFEESIVVLGELQNTMRGGDAGTAYRDFIKNLPKAERQLGLAFTYDVGPLKGKLLPIWEIMEKLRKRFGDTIPGSDSILLNKVFDVEGMRAMGALLTKSKELKRANDELKAQNMSKEFKTLQEMKTANLNNFATVLNRISFSFKNLMGTVGASLAETLTPLGNSIAKVIRYAQVFLDAHPAVSKFIGKTLLLITVLGGVSGAVLLVLGAIKYLSAFMVGTLMKSILATGAAFMATPLGWIIATIAGLALLVIYWDEIKIAAVRAWTSIKEIAGGAWDWIQQKWSGAPGWFRGLVYLLIIPFLPLIAIVKGFIAVSNLIIDNWENIKTGIGGAVDWLSNKFQELSAWWDSVKVPAWLSTTGAILAMIFAPFIKFPILIIANWQKVWGFFSWLFGNIGSLLSIFADFVESVLIDPRLAFWIFVNDIFNWFNGIFEDVKAAFSKALDWMGTLISNFFNSIGGPFKSIANLFMPDSAKSQQSFDFFKAQLTQMNDIARKSGKDFMSAFSSGIQEGGPEARSGLWGVFDKINKLTPHSDAEEGPFSNLTQSGFSIPATMAEGMESGAARFRSAWNNISGWWKEASTPVRLNITEKLTKAPEVNSSSTAYPAGGMGNIPAAQGPIQVHFHIGALANTIEIKDGKVTSEREIMETVRKMLGKLSISGAGA